MRIYGRHETFFSSDNDLQTKTMAVKLIHLMTNNKHWSYALGILSLWLYISTAQYL